MHKGKGDINIMTQNPLGPAGTGPPVKAGRGRSGREVNEDRGGRDTHKEEPLGDKSTCVQADGGKRWANGRGTQQPQARGAGL